MSFFLPYIAEKTSKFERYKANISFSSFLISLKEDKTVRDKVIELFLSSSFSHIFWEFPKYKKNKQLEFVFYNSSSFPTTDSSSFYSYFTNKKENNIISFMNISGDTQLITVVSHNNNKYYSDIMNFMRHAEDEVKHELLIIIAEQMLNNEGKYLSTHGFGVPYLHVRICNKPKYYSYEKYKI